MQDYPRRSHAFFPVTFSIVRFIWGRVTRPVTVAGYIIVFTVMHLLWGMFGPYVVLLAWALLGPYVLPALHVALAVLMQLSPLIA